MADFWKKFGKFYSLQLVLGVVVVLLAWLTFVSVSAVSVVPIVLGYLVGFPGLAMSVILGVTRKDMWWGTGFYLLVVIVFGILIL